MEIEDLQANVSIELQPYFRLWAAVFHRGLSDAAVDFFNGDTVPGSAYWWAFDSEATHPGSFLWLCELFSIDPDIARSQARSKFRVLAQASKNLERS